MTENEAVRVWRAVYDPQQPLRRVRLPDAVAAGDVLGHRLEVTLPCAVQGAQAWAVRADGSTVLCPTALDGLTICAELPGQALAQPGAVSLLVRVSDGERVTTVYWADLLVQGALTDEVLDPASALPEL